MKLQRNYLGKHGKKYLTKKEGFWVLRKKRNATIFTNIESFEEAVIQYNLQRSKSEEFKSYYIFEVVEWLVPTE